MSRLFDRRLFRDAARVVSAEIAAMPSPDEVVDVLVASVTV